MNMNQNPSNGSDDSPIGHGGNGLAPAGESA